MRQRPFLAVLFVAASVWADGPADNIPDKVRAVPGPGIKLPDDQRTNLQAQVEKLGQEIEQLRSELNKRPSLLALLPDVQIFHKAVHDALKYNEFYNVKEGAVAGKLLQLGFERLQQLRAGKPAWATATGLVVRGYVSKIDGSVQPYGLIVPASYQPEFPHRYRLDFWCHGRGEFLTELSFLDQRLRSPGEFTPPNAFVLHLYGRYCNANKFAGEVDLFEAYESVKKHYPIDDTRLVIRGFSMGGAACWQFAVHFPGMWAAAAPGAGFSETLEFLTLFQGEKVRATPSEKKLWHLYDCTDYAGNLFNCPTVAYSGEKDRQKQAADIMAQALEKEGIQLTHVIGPGTAHSYHPAAKVEINRRLDAIVARGRDPLPRRVQFTTWTLRYNRSHWVQIDGLEQHWERARVVAELGDANEIRVKTENVTALTLDLPPGTSPFSPGRIRVQVDGSSLQGPLLASDGSLRIQLQKDGTGWKIGTLPAGSPRKRHGLQGPIDDAFLDRFVMVRPTGKPAQDAIGKWVDAEQRHALEHWRSQFRGEALVKDDTAVTDEDIAASNLVLWGDPASNRVLARIADKLPIRWTADRIELGSKSFAANQHVPLLICPNPLNPQRYVVLNSGFTFREYDYLNNARQVPKLPDYAIVDVKVPVNSRYPGGIVDAGFFTEQWRLPGSTP